MSSEYSLKGGTKRRVHSMGADGLCQQEPKLIDEAGNMYDYPITEARKMTADFVKQKGGVIMAPQSPPKQQQQMQQQQNAMPFAVGETEKVTGQPELMRVEMPSADGGSNTLTLTIDNGETDAQEILLGDGADLNKLAFNVANKAGGVTIGGSFGADTLDAVQKQVAGGALRLHGIHITNTNSGSASTDFFDSGKMDLCLASPINNTNSRNKYDFQRLVGGDTFNTNIREDKNFRFSLAPRSALLFTVPAGEKIVVTFTLRSATSSYAMNMVGQ